MCGLAPSRWICESAEEIPEAGSEEPPSISRGNRVLAPILFADTLRASCSQPDADTGCTNVRRHSSCEMACRTASWDRPVRSAISSWFRPLSASLRMVTRCTSSGNARKCQTTDEPKDAASGAPCFKVSIGSPFAMNCTGSSCDPLITTACEFAIDLQVIIGHPLRGESLLESPTHQLAIESTIKPVTRCSTTSGTEPL